MTQRKRRQDKTWYSGLINFAQLRIAYGTFWCGAVDRSLDGEPLTIFLREASLKLELVLIQELLFLYWDDRMACICDWEEVIEGDKKD